MDKEGGADTLSSPPAGGTGRTSSDEDAGPRALQGAKEVSKKVKKTRDGLRRGEASDAKSEDSSDDPSSEDEEEEAEEDEPHSDGGRKRMASTSL